MSITMCRGCGQALPGEAAFCGNCGVRAASSNSVDTVVQARAVLPQQQTERLIVAPAPVSRASMQGRLLAVLAVVALVVGVAGRLAYGAMTPDEGPGELVAQLPLDPQGGKTSFDNGNAEMEVPKGAVSKPETVKVYKRVIDRQVRAVPPSGGDALVIPPGTVFVYTFGPTSIRLNVPIIIRIALPGGQRGFVFVTARRQIRFLPGVGTGRKVTIVVRSFNLGQPGAVTVRG